MRPLFVALASAVSVVAFAHMASAADLYQPAYKAAPPPNVPGWTGWYLGVNAGASFGNVNTDFEAPSAIRVSVPGGPPVTTDTGFAGSNREYPSGFMGGGQIGYNWQFSPMWVVGFEADFQGALEKDTNNLSNPFSFTTQSTSIVSSGTVTGSTVFDYQSKIEWFGTARLRAGYVWGNMDVFSYVTGGLAYGKVDLEGTGTTSATLSGGPFTPSVALSLTQAFDHSQVNTGWTVGYGTEGRLAGMPRWSWKIEGLYMDLGHLDATGSGGGSINNSNTHQSTTLTAGPVTTHSHFTDGILRGGLNYHF